MYITHRGRRFFLVQGYRDGRGSVCQRRLGHFLDERGLERLLEEVPARYPELAANVEELRRRGQSLLATRGPADESNTEARVERLKRAARRLRDLLADEDEPEVLRQVTGELAQVRARLGVPVDLEEDEAERCLAQDDLDGAEVELLEVLEASRSACSARRRCLEDRDELARPYLRALDRLSDVYRRQGRLQDCLEIVQERVERCPDAPSRLLLATTLHRLGRCAEAVEEYRLLPVSDPRRFYNSAAACWAVGREEEAIAQILAGLLRQTEVPDVLLRRSRAGPGAQYWREYADLWPVPARRFLLAASHHTGVRSSLHECRQTGIRKRRLLSPRSQALLLEHAREASRDPARLVLRRQLPLRDWMVTV